MLKKQKLHLKKKKKKIINYQMTRKYFGTDGIRGKTGKHPITAEFFIKLGYAAGAVLTKSWKNK